MDPLYQIHNGNRRCPYNTAHTVSTNRFIAHLLKCEKISTLKLVVCPWNATHHVHKDKLKDHVIKCESKEYIDSLDDGTSSIQGTPMSLAYLRVLQQKYAASTSEGWLDDEGVSTEGEVEAKGAGEEMEQDGLKIRNVRQQFAQKEDSEPDDDDVDHLGYTFKKDTLTMAFGNLVKDSLQKKDDDTWFKHPKERPSSVNHQGKMHSLPVGRGQGYIGRGQGYIGRGQGYIGKGQGYIGRGQGYIGSQQLPSSLGGTMSKCHEVTKQTLPEDVDSEDPVTKQTLPQDVDSEDPVTKQTLPQDVDSKDPVTKQTLPEDVDSEDPVTKQSLSQAVPTKDLLAKQPLSRNVASEEVMPTHSMSQAVTPQGTATTRPVPLSSISNTHPLSPVSCRELPPGGVGRGALMQVLEERNYFAFTRGPRTESN